MKIAGICRFFVCCVVVLLGKVTRFLQRCGLGYTDSGQYVLCAHPR